MKNQIDEDDDKVLRDGQVSSFPLMLMDSLQREVAASAFAASAVVFDAANHRPHYAPITDAERQKRRTLIDEADKALSDRWKHPPSLHAEVTKPVKVTQPSPTTDMAALYADRDKKLSERWKGATA